MILDKLKNSEHSYISGIDNAPLAEITAAIENKFNNNILIIAENSKQTEKLLNDIKFFLNNSAENINITIFPEINILPYDNKPFIRQNSTERIKLLYYLMYPPQEKNIIITTVKNILFTTINKEYLKDLIISLETGKEYDFEKIKKILIDYNYSNESKTYEPGQFSIRGDIIDIYIPIYKKPVRLEFFDNILEDIRFFDTSTQKSTEQIKQIYLLPASEIILSEENIKKAEKKINNLIKHYFTILETPEKLWNLPAADPEKLKQMKHTLINRGSISPENLFFLLYNKYSSILDYTDKYIVFMPNTDKINNIIYDIKVSYKKKYKDLIKENNFAVNPEKILYSPDEIKEKLLRSYKIVEYSILPFNKKEEIRFRIEPISNYGGNYLKLKSDFDKYLNQGYSITFISEYKDELTKIRETMRDNSIDTSRINFAEGVLSHGYINSTFKNFYIQDFEFFGKIRIEHSRDNRKILAQNLESIYDLKEGDYVVHIEKGIGIFKGIKQIETDGSKKDYFELEFANRVKLYLPLERINMLQKFIGDSNVSPKLSNLKSEEFQKTKLKVKKSIITVAKELLKVYAQREKLKGFKFPEDTEWQREFESSFPYVETPDQIKAIKEIKTDMESEKPMDRLLCGDVGYGKTEIALRAAFKAVMSGKQVAVLVPTTILAQQHYLTFTERLLSYPITIEMMSKLTGSKEMKKIKNGLKNGSIDIVIGTHRILSNDVKFKDIGLLIIDEEQKFGVLHKEKLKIIKATIDVLTMSATPIPRTLYMSLSGIRDISILDTAPEGRIPIETVISKFSPEIIREAIIKELNRGGQVYFVHNRVRTIQPIANYIKKIVPEARISVVHGQMDPDEMEIKMIDFIEKKTYVLVSTTIIESWIDIPNAQTIIINRADRFGLSQLYQLRGRVGRSKNISYAYLLYPGEKSITDLAYKRLSTIYEYTELGSGYKIALRDLEIRGSGNIFGPQQHGNIMSVGLELYSKILTNAIKELKGEQIAEEIDPVIDFDYNAFIPDSFIHDTNIKIEIYKKLNRCSSETEIENLFAEITDRFGKNIPSELQTLFDIYYIKIYLKLMSAEYIKIAKRSRYEITFEILVKKISKKWIKKVIPSTTFKNNKIYIIVEKNNFIKKLKKRLPLFI